MKFEPSLSNREINESLKGPAWATPVSKATLLNELRGYFKREGLTPDQARVFKHLIRCTETYAPSEIVIEESFFEKFLAWIKDPKTESDCPKKHRGRVVSFLITVLNQIGESRPDYQRELINTCSFSRRARFARLTEFTRDALVHYEAHAKQMNIEKMHIAQLDGSTLTRRRFTLRNASLAGYPRANRIARFISFMEQVNQTCATEVSAHLIRQYLIKEPDSGRKTLTELESVFANFQAIGVLRTNPLCEIDYERPPRNIRSEFVPQKGIDLLMQAAALRPFESPREARALPMAAFLYDTALRVRQAIRRYLTEYRCQQTASSNYLFVTLRGKRLSATSALEDLKYVCEKVGTRTHSGKQPSPHMMRHSFATLNIAPLGLGLSLDEITTRLGHCNRELARRVYIEDNPCLEQAKHMERVADVQQPKSSSKKLNQDEVLDWLGDDLHLPAEVLAQVRAAIQKAQEPIEEIPLVAVLRWDQEISEQEAVELLAGFTASPKDIRVYFSANESCREDPNGWIYDEAAIWGFRKTYVSIAEAMETAAVTRATVYNNPDLFGLIRIGRRRFASRAGIRQYVIERSR